MKKLLQLFFFMLFTLGGIHAQIQVKVYEFEEGLSHRITSKIVQSENGFIWIGTINGLNRFDGYNFIQYNDDPGNNRQHLPALPFSSISDMQLASNNHLWLAGPDHLAYLDVNHHRYQLINIKQGPSVARESIIPYSLYVDQQEGLWTVVFDEKSARNKLLKVNPTTKEVTELMPLQGSYPQRPMIQVGSEMYLGAYGNELWKLSMDGKVLKKMLLPLLPEHRIISLARHQNTLYILSTSGRLYTLPDDASKPFLHPASIKTEAASALMIEPNGNVWIGGRGVLSHYRVKEQSFENLAPQIRDITKNTSTYHQIFRGSSGVIWVASDFGAIKLTQGEKLFTNYLQGGNEDCSNIFCSTRGITEDNSGNIYFSYYSSIHVLNPLTNTLRPLFPSRDFFNAPFGLTYFKDALWTGNGKRIDLQTRRVSTILEGQPEKDLGHVVPVQDSILWMGYNSRLYLYDPALEVLKEFEDSQGKWDSLNGDISYLHPGRKRKGMWAATLNNGVYWIDQYKERTRHYDHSPESPVRLRHNQVNALYEDQRGRLWIGTASGLHCLYPSRDSLETYTTTSGLPNDFINGILPEGDSCLWISTDNGLSRFNLSDRVFKNFSVKDGISANEFNRMSFFLSSTGRMYFGGLNGVNAFYPGKQFIEQKHEQGDAHILLTSFSKFDDLRDSLVVNYQGFTSDTSIVISPWDRIFTFEFTLSDYRDPRKNVYSYQLDGYDRDWSLPSKNREVRYHNIPAGNYTFRVRAKANGSSPVWNSEELSISIIVKEAFYKTLWFKLLAGLLLISIIFAITRYRFFLERKRQHELEALVQERTKELEKEKQKSEELLLNILPAETAEELKANGVAKAKRHEVVTVMFSDFKGFSKISEHMDPEDLVAEIDLCFCAFDEIMEKYRLEKIKTVGDAYLCVGGMHDEDDDDADEARRVTMAALEIQSFMEGLAIQRKLEDKHYFEARIGIHTGPVVAGIVGIKKFAYDIWGDTVNLAARMETNGAVGRVNISGRTFQLIRDRFSCRFHGSYTETDGEDIPMYFVEEYLADS
jgi:class 3 adenylate cyclase/ligand-binding sensor domain-containing protein